MTICERLERTRVAIADIQCSGPADEPAKVRRFKGAMARGEAFPPVFLLRLDGELWLNDGAHRLTAAEALGHHDADAVIFDARSLREADAIGDVCFRLQAFEALGRIAANNGKARDAADQKLAAVMEVMVPAMAARLRPGAPH